MTAKDNKVATVMREFKRGTLKSSTGKKVTDSKQAKAIAISEGNKVMRKKVNGGGSTKKKTPAKKTTKKKQGFNAKLEKKMGRRKFAAVKTMDKGRKKRKA